MSVDTASLFVEAFAAAFGASVGVGAVYLYSRRNRKPKPEAPKGEPRPATEASDTLLFRGPTKNEVESSRRELRLLKMEKEYLSGALTRVYEAEVQGRITKDEMQYLSQKYRGELQAVDEKLAKAQAVVEVADLENAREELLSLVNNKVAQIDARLRDLKVNVGPELPPMDRALEPLKEEKREKVVETRKEKAPVMDEKLKKVVDDISEAMAKLEQMDMEQ
ncbi:MAG TPA: hypothetical protein VMS77_08865 [Conexivisphaerales archaeon]|nr:hypothetical protein [Conexivisphaerales archaeon]